MLSTNVGCKKFKTFKSLWIKLFTLRCSRGNVIHQAFLAFGAVSNGKKEQEKCSRKFVESLDCTLLPKKITLMYLKGKIMLEATVL